MTVENLINELSQYDPDMEVRIYPEGIAPLGGFEVVSIISSDEWNDEGEPVVLICDEDET